MSIRGQRRHVAMAWCGDLMNCLWLLEGLGIDSWP